MRGIKNTVSWVIHAIGWVAEQMGMLAGMLTLLVMAVVVYEVVVRYILKSPTSWSLEVTELLIPVCVFFSLAYALRLGRHINVDFVTSRLSRTKQFVLSVITSVLSLIYFALLTWRLGVRTLYTLSNNVRTTGVTPLPISPTCILIFVGSFVVCLALGVQIWSYLSKKR